MMSTRRSRKLALCYRWRCGSYPPDGLSEEFRRFLASALSRSKSTV